MLFRRLIKESVSYNYELPSRRDEMLYDFYIWTLFYELSQNKEMMKSASLKSRIDEDSIYDLISIAKEATEKIVYFLYEEILEIVKISVIHEIRYGFEERSQIDSIRKRFKNNEKVERLINSYIPIVEDNGDPYEAFLNSDLTIGEFASIAKEIFKLKIWEPLYGGENWSKIANGLYELEKAQTLKNKIIWLDHIFDLQHNTGSVLNKSKKYSIDGSHFWIIQALDFKFNATIWQLQKRSSIPIRIVGKYARLFGLDDKQTFEKKQEELFDLSDKRAVEKLKSEFKYYFKNLSKTYLLFNWLTNHIGQFDMEKYKPIMEKYRPIVEEIVFSLPHTAYYYVKTFIGKEYPKAEKIIATDAQSSYGYAVFILGKRFPAGEETIKNYHNKSLWNSYKKEFKIK